MPQRFRAWYSAHVTARPSTLILSALFVIVLVLYFLIRPISANHAAPRRTYRPAPTATKSSTAPRTREPSSPSDSHSSNGTSSSAPRPATSAPSSAPKSTPASTTPATAPASTLPRPGGSTSTAPSSTAPATTPAPTSARKS